MEHGPGDFMTLVGQLHALQASAPPTLVRVAANDAMLVKRTLDAGAGGVVVPLVSSPAEAEAAVKATKYPPNGIRGIAKGTRAAKFGAGFSDYYAEANERLLTVIQIETLGAIESVEEIAAIDGIDVFFIGPMDFTTSLGVQGKLDSPTARDALKRVSDAASRNGVAMGIHAASAEQALAYRDQGYRLVAVGSDSGMLSAKARETTERLRGKG
jgi:2-keto-3-deoxy-L-rhamnonate aldolase RhmA